MKRIRVVETVTETSLGPRSAFAVEERRWWGWKDVSTIDGYRLGSAEQVADFLRRRSVPDRTVNHGVEAFAASSMNQNEKHGTGVDVGRGGEHG